MRSDKGYSAYLMRLAVGDAPIQRLKKATAQDETIVAILDDGTLLAEIKD